MRRIQFIVRDWGTAKEAQLDGGQAVAPMTQMHLVYGVMEVPAGSVADDTRFTFIMDLASRNVAVCEPHVLGDGDHPSDSKVAQITSWLRRTVWRGPTSPLPPQVLAGQVIGRRCALEVGSGLEAVLFCGIASASMPLPKDRLATMADGIGRRDGTFELVSPGPSLEFEMGAAADWVYHQPIWGWGAEPVGFLTTLRMDLSDECDRLRPLAFKENRSREETALVSDFAVRSGGLLSVGNTDPMFRRYYMLQRTVNPDTRPATAPRTAADLDARGHLARITVAAMREHPDDDAAALDMVRRSAEERGLAVLPAEHPGAAPKP